MERLRTETIEEFFFEATVWDDDGHIVPAPPEAVEKYSELKREWMEKHPRLENEIPGVALMPIYTAGRVGYIVSTQIIYKPKTVLSEG